MCSVARKVWRIVLVFIRKTFMPFCKYASVILKSAEKITELMKEMLQ